MSRAVKSVGRAVSKVVKGAVSGVKKFAKSKFGKVIIGAALVYFGGAALMGAMGTGTTAVGGLQAAWSGLGTAVGGGGTAGMTSAFMTGAAPGVAAANATAAAGAAAGSMAPGAATAGLSGASTAPMASGMAPSGAGLSVAPAAPAAANVAPAAANLAGAAKPSMWQTMLTSPHTAPALVQAGGTMLSSLGNAKAQEEMWKRQQQMTEEERARYSRNIGSSVNFQQPRRG